MKPRLPILATTTLLALGLSGCSQPPEDEPRTDSQTSTDTSDAHWTQTVLVPGGPFHGVHGLTFDAGGRLLVGSVVGARTHAVDPETGATEVVLPHPEGMADDLDVGPDGSLAWTGFLTGELWIQRPDEPRRRIAKGFPGANSLAFTEDGRLFFTQVFLGDALYEADPEGNEPPRQLMEGMGGLNGFDFGPDGHLYGPLWFRGQIARVDVDAETLEVVAEGFDTPAAVNFDSRGNLYAIDTVRGELLQVNLEGGEHRLVAELPAALDNLAIAPDDSIYVTNMADNAVFHVDPASGEARTVVDSPLSVAGDIALAEDGKSVYVADVFSLRRVNLADGSIIELARQYQDELETPMSVGTGAGRIAVTSWSAGVIQLFDADSGESLGLHHDLPSPMDAVPLGDGAVLFLDFADGRLIRAEGAELEQQTVIAEGLQQPVSLVLDDAGQAWVSEYGAGRVVRINLDTGERESVVEGLDAPEGIALATDGSLYIAETGSQRLLQWQASAEAPRVLATDLPMGYPAPPGTPAAFIPTGVVAAPDGSVIVSSDVDVGLYRLSRP